MRLNCDPMAQWALKREAEKATMQAQQAAPIPQQESEMVTETVARKAEDVAKPADTLKPKPKPKRRNMVGEHHFHSFPKCTDNLQM